MDYSDSMIWALVAHGPVTPQPLCDLWAFMASPPAAKLPITKRVMHQISSHPVAKHFTPVDYSTLGEIVANSVGRRNRHPHPTNLSKIGAVLLQHSTVVQVIEALDSVLRLHQTIGLSTRYEDLECSSLMSVVSRSGRDLRPDGVMQTCDGWRMLATWEIRSSRHTLQEAVADLQAKTAAWTPLYFGEAQYLPCYVAVGDKVQFFAIPRERPNLPVAITPILFTSEPGHRAELVLYCVKFYQLLRAQNNVYPTFLQPAGKHMVSVTAGPMDESVTHALYFRTDRVAVQKRIQPWSLYARWTGVDFGELAALYKATARAQGLVHAATGGPQLSDFDDLYTVVLEPVGRPHSAATPWNEEEQRRAAHGLLHGLAAIHAAKCVHRDLQWANVSANYDKTRWFLLDLEMCVRVDRACPPTQRMANWTAETLVEGCYVAASDVYRLGRMLQDHGQRVPSPSGREFLRLLARPAHELHADGVTAASLLEHAWLRCPGAGCTEAGAQPGETGSA